MRPFPPDTHTDRGYVLALLYRLQALQDEQDAGRMTHAAYCQRRDEVRALARQGIAECRRRG